MIKYTPMLEQYLNIKKSYKDCLLFFRLGDFYELFFEDAVIASSLLNITLTKKSAGKDLEGNAQKIDMCGVPFHSADGYISKLVSKGHKIAICEQVEDPKLAKKIVEREVIRVITPGTILDTSLLDQSKNNYIMCIYNSKIGFGISFADISTGDFFTTSFKTNEFYKIIDEIAKYTPSEVICNENIDSYRQIEDIFNIKLNNYSSFTFNFNNAKDILCKHFKVANLKGFGLDEDSLSICSSGALLSYLLDTQKNELSHITNLKKYYNNKYMVIDISSRRNLELTENILEKSKKGSLLWVLDKTKTPMGARLLRNWVEEPLISVKNISKRLDSVDFLTKNIILKEELRHFLTHILDIERICSKTIYLTANARDLVSLKKSFEILPQIKNCISNFKSESFNEIYSNLDDLNDLYNLINNSIEDDPPFSIREGNIIKTGYNTEVDKFRKAKNEGTTWIVDLENKEREKTGIKNLKIRFNKVFGYYIEVTNSNLNLVPEYFIRRQTLSNCERYVTEELKNIEETILSSDEKIVELEYNIFCKIRDKISQNIDRIKATSKNIAILDCYQSLAEVAYLNNYCKPQLIDNSEKNENKIEILEGRHPVIELISENKFIPNNTLLDENENRLNIITGPNMAGKSTYMRQVALITLMAQIGSFVPAKSAKISVVDRIFTRIGASDSLATGQSTFMIEMNEVANIINNATKNSLLILDEIGRGTSTFDGLSIAWSVLEYIATKIKSKTLFATHYHELTNIEGKVEGVNNYCVEVKEDGKEIVFLRNIIKGIAGKSYGIHVAKIAGIPKSIIKRANEILDFLNNSEIVKSDNYNPVNNSLANENNFYYTQSCEKTVLFVDELERDLNTIDINSLSPIDAWSKLFEIKNKLSNL